MNKQAMKSSKNPFHRNFSFVDVLDKTEKSKKEQYSDLCALLNKKILRESSKTKFVPIADVSRKKGTEKNVSDAYIHLELQSKRLQKSKAQSEEKIEIISFPTSTLPKVRDATLEEKRKTNRSGNFTIHKFKVNETVYIQKERQSYNIDQIEQIREKSSLVNSILSSRSKKLNELRSRQLQNPERGPISAKNQINKLSIIEAEKSVFDFKRNKLIESILKSEERKMKASEDMRINFKEQNSILNHTFYQNQMKGTPKAIEEQSIAKVTKHKWKSMEKTYCLKEQYKLSLDKKKTNWKNSSFPLVSIEKQQVSKVLKRYLRVQNIEPPSLGFYKFYIGEGNNSQLIKKCLKSKGYWVQVEYLSDNPHFVWTQLPWEDFQRKQTVINPLSLGSKTTAHRKQHTCILSDASDLKEMKEFLRLKNSSYLKGCQKLLPEKVFHEMAFGIMKKFKVGKKKLSSYHDIELATREWLGQNDPISLLNVHSQDHPQDIPPIKSTEIHLQNHIKHSEIIGNKKSLYKIFLDHCIENSLQLSGFLPATFNVHFQEYLDENVLEVNIECCVGLDGPWIVKPGEDTNRGRGIVVVTTLNALIEEIKKRNDFYFEKKSKEATNGADNTLLESGEGECEKSVIVQKYIEPFLYNGRKFDIRVWVLKTRGQLWWYREGYLRTSSKEFNLKSTNKYIHLTNDAIQMTHEDYGKYESANKLSFNEFQKYLSQTRPAHQAEQLFNQAYDSMRDLTKRLFKIADKYFQKAEPNLNFELFGLDFMIDKDFKVWLIECNTNPSLEVHCSLQSRLVPNLIENMVSIAIDPIFTCPEKRVSKQGNHSLWNQQAFKFEILLDFESEQI